MAKCSIFWDTSVQAYRMKCQFKPQLIEFLKKQIPHSERSWDESSKIWTFTEKYLDGVRLLAETIFTKNECAVLTRAQVEAAQKPPAGGISVRTLNAIDSALADFMRLISYDAARAAYRRAAVELHPDKGGDMEKMSKLNALWTKIEKEVYGQ
jgi:hypothetical protein